MSCTDEAIEYTSMGWAIVPLHGTVDRADGGSAESPLHCTCGKGEQCKGAGKHPIRNEWQRHVITDMEEAGRYFEDHPHQNIGVVLGPQSGIMDFETDSDVEEQILLDLFGGDIPVSACFKSGRGKHRLFKYSDKLPQVAVQSIGELKVKIGGGDKGTQSVFPPSRHRFGTKYTWLLHPRDCSILDLPARVIARLNNGGVDMPIFDRPVTAKGKSAEYYAQISQGVTEGNRNEAATKWAGRSLVGNRVNDQTWVDMMFGAFCGWNALNKPPLDIEELAIIWNNILQREKRAQQTNERRQAQLDFEAQKRARGIELAAERDRNAEAKREAVELRKQQDDALRNEANNIIPAEQLQAAVAAGATRTLDDGEVPSAEAQAAIDKMVKGWGIVIRLTDPREFLLFSPYWKDFVVLDKMQLQTPWKIVAECNEYKHCSPPIGFDRLWLGRPPRKADRSDEILSLKDLLLARATTDVPPPEESRRCAIAQAVISQLSKVTTMCESDKPDSTGHPQQLSDGSYVFSFTNLLDKLRYAVDRISRGELSKCMSAIGAVEYRGAPNAARWRLVDAEAFRKLRLRAEVTE